MIDKGAIVKSFPTVALCDMSEVSYDVKPQHLVFDYISPPPVRDRLDNALRGETI